MILFDIKTVKSSVLKTLIEGLKNVINEANLIVSQEGLKICQPNSTQKEVVYMYLESNQFEYYTIEKTCVIGIDLQKLYKIMKNAQPDDTVTLLYDDTSSEEILIMLENTFKRLLKRTTLKLLSLEKKSFKVPTIHYDNEITIGSLDLQKMCKEFHLFGCKVVSLTTLGNQLTFSSNDGTVANYEYVWFHDEESTSTKQQIMSFQRSNERPTQVSFMLDALQFSTKTTNINQFVKLYLANEQPLTVEYQTALGNLRFIIISLQ